MKKIQTNGGGIGLWVLVLLGVLMVIFTATKMASRSSDDNLSDRSIKLSESVSENDWAKWNTESETILIEYGDFQCPACGAYYPIVKRLEEEFGEDVKFVFRHFPLRQIHPNANIAAIAAEAAGAQDKFWEMHDMIFENQKTWSAQRSSVAEKTFVSYAQQLGLDIEQFEDDTKSKEIREIIDDSYKNASRFGVNSTPTFFLNGEKLATPRSYEDFQALLKQAILKTNAQNTTEQSSTDNS